MSVKYAGLVNHFLNAHHDSRIFHSDNTMVSVGVKGIAGSQIFDIYASYGNVLIRMEIRNNPIFGNLKREWTFPEDMPQDTMVEMINQDLRDMASGYTNN